jgi:thiamine biosynthesis protein ThiS
MQSSRPDRVEENSLIEITVNGERRQVPLGESVTQLLDGLKIASERVAIELNRTIVRKRDWAATIVAGGSQIEIVEFVGGG